ncbi:MAG TPA: hypothetical protein VMM58_11260 [Bacteroidota bacterium]|nr:hypothetical protein [Bacteroidota bacterium]
MYRKFLILGVLSLLFVGGCGEKKADPAKLDEVAKLIGAKNFDKGVPMIDEMAKESPSDPAVKKAQIDAHMQYANYFMYESTLPPKEKYPSALRQYRLVASIDPTNTEAQQNINLIEGIYNQMGRPIPQ